MGVVEGGCPALNGVVLIQDDTTPKFDTFSKNKIARAVPLRKHYFSRNTLPKGLPPDLSKDQVVKKVYHSSQKV